mgnify:CR=1 FL=1
MYHSFYGTSFWNVAGDLTPRRSTRDVLPEDDFNRLPEDVRETLNHYPFAFRSEAALRQKAEELLRKA